MKKKMHIPNEGYFHLFVKNRDNVFKSVIHFDYVFMVENGV